MKKWNESSVKSVDRFSLDLRSEIIRESCMSYSTVPEEHFEVTNQEQFLCLCGLLLKVEIQGGVIIISPVYKTGLQLEVSTNVPYTFAVNKRNLDDCQESNLNVCGHMETHV